MEEWRTVVIDGEVFEDYEVSNLGNVRSLKFGKIKILKTRKQQNGYLTVTLFKNEKSKQVTVHRVVAWTWIPNDEPTVKTVVNHLDHNRQNNVWTNLEWTTQQKNVEDGRGKRVRCIETGVIYESLHDVERKTGISSMSVHYCCTGKRKSCKYGKLHFEYVD